MLFNAQLGSPKCPAFAAAPVRAHELLRMSVCGKTAIPASEKAQVATDQLAKSTGNPAHPTAGPDSDSLGAITWETNPHTYPLSFVTLAADLLGYDRERWLARPDAWLNLVFPKDRP